MTAPHETPLPGAAADVAAALAARLPVLDSPRLRLRAPVLGDFDLWACIFRGPSGVHLGGPFDRDEAFTEFAAAMGLWLLRGHGPWTITDRDTGAALGFVLIGFEPGDQEPELGWLLAPGAEGQGFATEAAALVLDHARTLGLPGLLSYIDADNPRSAAVARRLGARRDAAAEAAVEDVCHAYRHFGPEIAA
jgi:RimJ/RimL family protein N-acetyltransferase